MPYDIFQHKHNFSVWAAARATQRAFTTVENLRQALENCGIVEFLRDPECLNVDQQLFSALHMQWCRSIVSFLNSKRIPGASFGRAAKLVGVYLKSMVVVGGDPYSKLARIAHPPIDAIMLHNLSMSVEVHSPHKKRWGSIKWTQMNEEEYYQLVSELAVCVESGLPLWHLEQYWTVTSE